MDLHPSFELFVNEDIIEARLVTVSQELQKIIAEYEYLDYEMPLDIHLCLSSVHKALLLYDNYCKLIYTDMEGEDEQDQPD